MAIVKRANVILNIEDEQIPFYLNKGYNVVSAGGKVLQAAIPTDINVLRKAYVDNAAKIVRLEKEIELLRNTSVDIRPTESVLQSEEPTRKGRKKRDSE